MRKKSPNGFQHLAAAFSLLVIFIATPDVTLAQDNPVMFCTQVPHASDFATLMSTFANHTPTARVAPRGGDLYIRYPNGNLKNITAAAGFGETGLQGANAIAVRDPHCHWSGNKALFSMVIGAPEQYAQNNYFWQIYEVTGLGENDTPVITAVNNQPTNYNNVSPIYGTDDRIIFVSDRPRGGQAHLYPQHDEYESTAIVTGLWRIDPTGCAGCVEMLTHSPSGDYTPSIDSAGRLVFVRWDHLKRDQQADADIANGNLFGTFNYESEAANAPKLDILPDIEVFPEPRAIRTDLFSLPEWQDTNQHDFNIFNPWMVNEDGTELETLNHIGRHELQTYFTPNFTNDPNLVEFIRANGNYLRNMFHMVESPTTPGLYFGTDAQEFGVHAAGMIVSLYAPAGTEPQDTVLTYITHPDTRFASDQPSANHSGLYRDPVPLTNGDILVCHTASTEEDDNLGTRANPQSKYEFRLQLLTPDGAYQTADGNYLSGNGITKSVTYYDPDVLVTHNGLMWETFPVEIVARPRPASGTLGGTPLSSIEQNLFDSAGVPVDLFRDFLRRKQIALVVSRNTTSRDGVDRQQPFNLRVAGGGAETVDPQFPTNIYEIKFLQFLQGDQLRGIGGQNSPKPGRRVIAQYMHDASAMTYNLPTTGEQGSVDLAVDGSAAAFVPANRAVTWQLTQADNRPVVRERIWMSFVAGEVRVCSSCHGGNNPNQAGQNEPENPPIALSNLLNHVKTIDSDNDQLPDIYDRFSGLDSLTVSPGVRVRGALTDLLSSDNSDLSIIRNPLAVSAETGFELQTGSAIAQPGSLTIEVEDSVFARNQIDRVIELMNYDSGSWEIVDARAASRFADRADTIVVAGDASRFVSAANNQSVEARVTYQSAVARQQFASNTDLFRLVFRE